MNIQEIRNIINRQKIINFTPESLRFLTETKNIEYKGKQLKTEFLLDIIHTFIAKCNKSKRDYEKIMKGYPINSRLLIKNYSNTYKYYLNYLIDNNYIVEMENYHVGLKAKHYRLNRLLLEEKHFYHYNLNKKLVKRKKERDLRLLLDPNSSTIDIEVRPYLYKDLYYFSIDSFQSTYILDTLFEKEEINKSKKDLNISSVEMINIKGFDFTFDKHGRFHSNYTRLRKEIRLNALRVNYNDKIQNTYEVDIKNSQPMFLLLLLKNNENEVDGEEYNDYRDECFRKDIYNRMIKMYHSIHGKYIDRKKAKSLFYQYLFGPINNNEGRKLFKYMFPSIDRYLTSYKKMHGYKKISHKLQNLESDLIYNKIVKEIKMVKDVPIITVHDSLICPESEKDLVKEIFYKNINSIFENYLFKF